MYPYSFFNKFKKVKISLLSILLSANKGINFFEYSKFFSKKIIMLQNSSKQKLKQSTNY